MNPYQLYRKAWRFDGPPDAETRLQEQEWKQLLKQGGLMVRNTYDFDCQEQTHFWYIIKDHYEGLEGLPPRVRNKVRKAEKTFTYRPIDYLCLRVQGYPIIKETFDDYAVRDSKMNEADFMAYLDECEKGNYDIWAIIDNETDMMVGFCLVAVWDNCCEYRLTGIYSKYKKNGTYPYYGLYHHLNQNYLVEKAYDYVSDSARTITEHSHIQDFLIQNFNFRKAYCQLEVHYQWWMKLAVNLLYPFRKIIPLRRVKAVLNMEAMQRGEQ